MQISDMLGLFLIFFGFLFVAVMLGVFTAELIAHSRKCESTNSQYVVWSVLWFVGGITAAWSLFYAKCIAGQPGGW